MRLLAIFFLQNCKTPEPERSIVSISESHVTAAAQNGDTLIIAGYAADGRMVKVTAASDFDTDISGFEGCAVIKAMLWDSLDSMIPYACAEYTPSN